MQSAATEQRHWFLRSAE